MAIFTPDDEPYLGRRSVFHFDEVIQVAMDQNSKIGPWTHNRTLTPLQIAATELIPHGFSIALSIRELIRQAYLISAEILLRPLMERAVVISYLCESPSALPLWEAGWPHKSRPPLHKMLAAINGQSGTADESEMQARLLTQHFNSIVHADPLGARSQVARLGDGLGGYTASKSVNDIERCDEICWQAVSHLIILMGRAAQLFPEAVDRGSDLIGPNRNLP
ncbi:hypothetical protein [Aquabacter spiritensis]|uniref:Uncharacterized protein n=1 Tax=Aquabacter spiritensis TaxID=933073 RepID=A0A4R3LTU1_9HYPH|nr:hypothetical protein [Aquabacter spiritensis]TCT03871.1 hypothetical protein EDC64_10836 [Aquabacter spiritensis]